MDKVAVVDFGGQYAHLITNRIRRLGVYSEIHLPEVSADTFKEYKAIIFSGGPNSTLDEGSPMIDPDIFTLGIPILGLCYGHQMIAKMLGGNVSRGNEPEYGLAQLQVKNDSSILKGLSTEEQIWMSHGDSVSALPEGFELVAVTEDCTYAAVANDSKKIYGLQFHPEVTDTLNGMKILENFIEIAGCDRSWNPKGYLEILKEEIVQQCEGKKVFLLVSGGVDSTVAFALLNEALGADRVLGLHVDNGLMRLNESEAILDYMKANGFENLHIFDGSQEFLDALDGISEPEVKRVTIGNKFLDIKDIAQKSLDLNLDEWLLAQGTIYPDTIESAGTKHSDKIKTHHNRVDIILEMIEKGLVIEPLAQLYKDEVRDLGEALGIPHDLVWRHPFPGPGLGVRVLCSDGAEQPVSSQALSKLTELAEKEEYKAYALPLKSVGVQGDSRTYANPALLTGKCDWKKLDLLSTLITNNVKAINRVVFGVDVSENPEYTLKKAYMTKERLDKLRLVDDLVTRTLREDSEYENIWQMPVVLLPLVNAAGDECVVLRPISSTEAMTARFYPLKESTLKKITDGVKEIDGIGDIFFDITNKPPATIEWE